MSLSGSGTGLSPALAKLSSFLPLPTHESSMPALQPRLDESNRFRLFPLRSPLLRESRLISFPSGTEMFHFPELASCKLCIHLRMTGHDSRRVSPIQTSPDRRMFSFSPRLIAAYHVFLRLPTPRHPPDALVYLFSKKTSFHPYAIVKELTFSGPPSSLLGSHSCNRTVTRLLPNKAWCKSML